MYVPDTVSKVRYVLSRQRDIKQGVNKLTNKLSQQDGIRAVINKGIWSLNFIHSPNIYCKLTMCRHSPRNWRYICE